MVEDVFFGPLLLKTVDGSFHHLLGAFVERSVLGVARAFGDEGEQVIGRFGGTQAHRPFHDDGGVGEATGVDGFGDDACEFDVGDVVGFSGFLVGRGGNFDGREIGGHGLFQAAAYKGVEAGQGVRGVFDCHVCRDGLGRQDEQQRARQRACDGHGRGGDGLVGELGGVAAGAEATGGEKREQNERDGVAHVAYPRQTVVVFYVTRAPQGAKSVAKDASKL